MELHSPLSRDNVSVVYLASNPIQYQCMKHIKIDLHFIYDNVTIGDVYVLHVSMTS
jgi:hypothetical protein